MKYTKFLILLISLVLILFSLKSVLFKSKKDKIIENDIVKIKEKKVNRQNYLRSTNVVLLLTHCKLVQ